MALSFRNDARQRIPGDPRNFNSYGGIVLRPLLFDALYLCSRIAVSSSVEMWCWDGLVSGVYESGMISSSKKMSLLNCVKRASCTSSGLVSVCFSMFQNLIGLYFRMSGRSN